MFINISHEYEVLQACFARQAAWITTEFARMSSDSKLLQNEDIEARLFHPQGPGSAEQSLCRMTINELNALVETALQDALVRVTGEFLFQLSPKVQSEVKLIYGLNRVELAQQLKNNGIDLGAIDGYKEVQQVKEISIGSTSDQHQNGMALIRRLKKWKALFRAQLTLGFRATN